jgi:Ca2+-binding RTX toxin-like protein
VQHLLEGGDGDGDDGLIGDSAAFAGEAVGAGNDVLLGGRGDDFLRGDSEADSKASGDGGDDVLDVGPDGGAAIGDHNTFDPGSTAIGAGNDKIKGGAAGEQFLVGDSSADNVTDAGNDAIQAGGGNDKLFGDNVGTAFPIATTGTIGGNDVLDADNGVDLLKGGPANDSLNGGPGSPDDCDGD